MSYCRDFKVGDLVVDALFDYGVGIVVHLYEIPRRGWRSQRAIVFYVRSKDSMSEFVCNLKKVSK